jgi:hypothetical protein
VSWTLHENAEQTAQAWALDGRPFLSVSDFAVLDMPLDDLLRRRFTSFRTVYLPAAGRLAECQFRVAGHRAVATLHSPAPARR